MLDDLEEAMRIQWRILHGEDEEGTDKDGSEFTLVATNYVKCYFCGEKGHKANKCPKKKRNVGNEKGGNSGKIQGKNFEGKCHTCGKTGHKKSACWEDEANSHLRPLWWKPKNSRNEQGLAATNGGRHDNTQLLFMGLNEMEFNATSKLLKDPNVFIGNTGATSNTTFSRLGLTNFKSANNGDNIFDASGNNISGEMVGDVWGTFFDKHGNDKNKRLRSN